MQDKAKSADTAGEDQQTERAVLAHVIDAHPATLRLSDLIRELGDPEDFSQRDGIERAVRELVKGGLLFRCEGAVLPTRAALYLSELGLA
ncbi:MAG TPA: hypothetical protein VFT79_09175 [Solirubrobacterales bacterium]|nr:hypothetical protein [Solirubrobacterales bacterium]